MSCEQLVGDLLQTDLGITDNIDMDQDRSVGSGILVTFRPLKQKALVLSKAMLLTPDKAVYILEDFPEAVRQSGIYIREDFAVFRTEWSRRTCRWKCY